MRSQLCEEYGVREGVQAEDRARQRPEASPGWHTQTRENQRGWGDIRPRERGSPAGDGEFVFILCAVRSY